MNDLDDAAIAAAKEAMMASLGDQLGVPVGRLDAGRVREAVEAAIREYEAFVFDEVVSRQ